MRMALKVSHALVVVLAGIVLILVVIRPARLLPASGFRRVRSITMSLWARWMIRVLGISRQVDSKPFAGNALFVVNHVSWIDILVLMATHQGVFLAKQELEQWPLIGWMCRQTDTLFLRRYSASAMARKVETIALALSGNESVFLFPEGTTTSGREVRAFYPGLFQAAVDARCPVQPIALKYREHGMISPTAPFIGDDDFRDHLRRILAARSIQAEVTFLPVLEPGQHDRRQLASRSQALIAGQLAA